MDGRFGNNTSDEEFRARLAGASLLTTEILYYRPDAPTLLQAFHWQTLDVAPQFPRLERFLDFWRREIEATIRSIRIAHAALLTPAEVRLVNGRLSLN